MVTYRQFPYRLWWQPVRVAPLNDDDYDYYLKDTQVNDVFIEENLRLNSRGAKIVNNVLETHPLGWGK